MKLYKKGKQLMICLVAVLFAAALLFQSGCAMLSGEADQNTPNGAQQGAPDEQVWYLMEMSADKQISVKLPVIAGEKQTTIHALLQSFVQSKLERAFGLELALQPAEQAPALGDVPDTEYWVELNARITWQSEDLISIVFEGMYNYARAAHPTHLFFSVNIVPDQAKQICFTERFALDQALYKTFAKCAENAILSATDGKWPEGWGSFSEELCSEQEFLNGLKNEDAFSWYYTETGVGISYPVPYALGDHLEVILPLDKIQAAA